MSHETLLALVLKPLWVEHLLQSHRVPLSTRLPTPQTSLSFLGHAQFLHHVGLAVPLAWTSLPGDFSPFTLGSDTPPQFVSLDSQRPQVSVYRFPWFTGLHAVCLCQ